ncbi:MAG: thioredoxin family protein [Muribaculaceae bacterium]
MKTLKFFFATIATAALLSFTGCKQQAEKPAESNVYVLPQGATFNANQAPEVLTIIDFNATWCGPCKQFAPIFDKASSIYDGKVKFISVDVDVHEDLARQLNIQSIPAVLFLKPDGTQEWSIGFMEEEEFCGKIDAALL